MHIENTLIHTHTQHSTCRISAISIQLFCIPSRAVKNAISHGVVNMKNKHIRKSLPPVNYLSPDCIWPFTHAVSSQLQPLSANVVQPCDWDVKHNFLNSESIRKTSESCLHGLLNSQTEELFAIWLWTDNQWILWQWGFHCHVFMYSHKFGCCALQKNNKKWVRVLFSSKKIFFSFIYDEKKKKKVKIIK